ncbi:SDR family oxidoreductase [Flocculibacter collagenilyticus]|uniref:SDR family oxidoreductase n=1 Tax=Flocculibacter collagenilyticus TaxID=2744479 RepID=UPI0018F53389|nr:SDR family oxidoreductase [Flocculibacter collagenilyticus]
MSENILIVGCGDIGTALGKALHSDGYCVTGLKRSTQHPAQSFKMLYGDVTKDIELFDLLTQSTFFDQVVVILTPTERSEKGYKQIYLQGLTNLLSALQQNAASVKKHTPKVFFISSTSVYSQNAGEWVNEQSATNPTNYRGRILLEAEQLITNFGTSNTINTIVRFSGIYGPNRHHLLKQVDEKKAITEKANPHAYTNRIHRNDCVGVLRFLINSHSQQASLAPLYLASDDNPAKKYDVVSWLAKQLMHSHYPESTILNEHTDLNMNKRCDNRLIIEAGYQLQFPSYQAGYISEIERYLRNKSKA